MERLRPSMAREPEPPADGRTRPPQPGARRRRCAASAPNCHALGELRPKRAGNTRQVQGTNRGTALAYRMIAERENESLNIERQSSLIIVAKARIFASEGWHVVITDADGKSYAPPEFDQLLPA
jgi:hypothetical protein